jgi:hypothetical protein
MEHLALNISMSPGWIWPRAVIGGAKAFQMVWVWCGTVAPIPAKA